MSNVVVKGRLFVISAPSGAGKSTLCAMMQERFRNIRYSVSYTSRLPRGAEKNGVDYFFVTREEFEAKANRGDFIEWAEVHGNLYGTSRETVHNALVAGVDIFLDIDPQGARQLRTKFNDAVFIFITAPSFEILRERLIKRGTDSLESIETRMINAQKEVEYYRDYDYLIVNDASAEAFENMASVYMAEKLRTKHIKASSEFIMTAGN